MKIYLTGPLQYNSTGAFLQMQEALNRISGPFEKNSPLDFGEGTDNSIKSHLQARLNNMLSCDMVVTMDHIDLDPLSKIEVSVARQASMQVVPFWKFMQDAKQE